ncbi:GH23442 [Drosophila grimshawi]|uniref:GH23442 n=1 Tax=Drosophila grimshawi TaxID=7222 RepID=B4K1A9_DROGR|nr:GH23442 [Drosophila grimshawi]
MESAIRWKAAAVTQRFLDGFSTWAKRWNICVNGSKSQQCMFALRNGNCPTVRLNNKVIPQENHVRYLVSGLGDTNVRTEDHTVEICFKSQVSDYGDSITALVSPTITDSQHGIAIGIQNWNIPANYKSQRVDLLVGASMFLLCVGQIKLWEVGSCSVGLNSSEEKSIEEHSKQDQQLTGAAEATTADTKQATQPMESAIRWNCES